MGADAIRLQPSKTKSSHTQVPTPWMIQREPQVIPTTITGITNLHISCYFPIKDLRKTRCLKTKQHADLDLRVRHMKSASMTRRGVQKGFVRKHLTAKMMTISCHGHTNKSGKDFLVVRSRKVLEATNTGPAEVLHFWNDSASLGFPLPHHQENLQGKLGISLIS